MGNHASHRTAYKHDGIEAAGGHEACKRIRIALHCVRAGLAPRGPETGQVRGQSLSSGFGEPFDGWLPILGRLAVAVNVEDGRSAAVPLENMHR